MERAKKTIIGTIVKKNCCWCGKNYEKTLTKKDEDPNFCGLGAAFECPECGHIIKIAYSS